MKCINCGAETQEEICEYCGSEMPNDNTVKITNNYYTVTEASNDGDSDAGKCPKCGNSKIEYNREQIATTTKSKRKGKKGRTVSTASYKTVGVCQNCGYSWNPDDESKDANKKNSKIWLWVLGWIFIFPVPLTILLIKKTNLKPAIKYTIIALVWVFYLLIGILGGANAEPTTDSTVPSYTYNYEYTTNYSVDASIQNP